MIEEVTPNIESVPERSYKRQGSEIQCFKVLENGDKGLVLYESPLFTIDTLSEEEAIFLMEDLYYGEYTGA